jgi:CheY-like chemotaxis protein
MLLNWNAMVEVAVNGELAIAKYKENEYDIILMDLQMPIMDGLTASKIIRALGGTLPIVALTASALDDVKYSVEAAGINGYISKPFNPDELYSTIKNMLVVKK